MILNCVESTFWKRTLSFLVRSSLSLGYCLMVMLGGRLFTNESHARVPCEITVSPHLPSIYSRVVVVQNTDRDGLNIHKEPHKDAETLKDDEGNDVQVYDTDMGVVRTDPKWGDKYFAIEIDKLDPEKLRIKHVWYYVRWDSGKEGWSAGIIYGVKHIDTVSEADLKDAIVEALFNCKNNPVYITHDQTNHDYNDYRCNANWKPEGKRIYGGEGHAGWDVQTSDKAPVPFYSLTAGKLVSPVDGTPDENNTIAVYNEDDKRTILYLHARDILVKPDDKDMVHVGQLLGTQGREGNAKGVHVHIEVQKGEVTAAASWVNENTINPLEYLRKWIVTEGGGEDTASGGGNTAREKGVQFDVNDDDEVDLLDQLLVLRHLGTDNLLYDLNGDGVVDLKDWRKIVDYEDNSPASSTRAVQVPLEDQTRLLTNYPNPFNPETWIPYQLALATEVNISIYAADGALVRTLDLGHQPAGLYLQRNRAAYWDGKNAVGETVASGMYFYTLTVGDFTATRRMMISR